MTRYFLKFDIDNAKWQEVTLEEFVAAERSAGFRGGNVERGKTATGAFSGHGVRGRVEYAGGEPA